MSNNLEKDFNLGGTLERALSGDYQLKMSDVLKEAWQCTLRHFLSFSPAIVILIIIQLAIFVIAFRMMVGDPSVIFSLFIHDAEIPAGVIQGILIANFSYEVVSAPIYAGVSLMAMSHVAGLKTKTSHITKGLQFTIPVIIATLFSLLLQGIAGMIFPLLSMYFSLAFSNAILLICEKRILPMQALWVSLRAVNKKLLPLAGIYALMMLMFVAGVMFYGIGLIFVIPFFFHVKGIIYRTMFGIRLQIVTNEKPHDDHNNHHDQNSDVFNA